MPWTETTRPHYERRCQRYASDLTNAEWALIEPLMPVPNRIGRPRKTDLREVVNALLYMASSGGAWRLLPKDFPPFSTVQRYFRRWRDEGLLRAISNELVMAAREAEGREASPSAGVIDSQSVKTTESGGVRGFDAGKKVKGRKRHIVVDTSGLLVGVVAHAADIQDRDGAPAVLKSILKRWPWLRHVFADGGYAGPKLRGALQKIGKFTMQIVKRSDSAKGFEVLPRRWRRSEPLHGWAGAEGWPRTSSAPSNPHRPGFTSQTSACSPDGLQGPENTAVILIQTLKGQRRMVSVVRYRLGSPVSEAGSTGNL